RGRAGASRQADPRDSIGRERGSQRPARDPERPAPPWSRRPGAASTRCRERLMMVAMTTPRLAPALAPHADGGGPSTARRPIALSAELLQLVAAVDRLPQNQDGADKTWVELAIAEFRDHYLRARPCE